MVRWWAQAYPARFAAPDLPGCRNAGDVLFRTTANGNFAMVVASSPRSGLDCVLERAKVTGHFTATFAMRSGIWKVALLKSAYLAACLHLGEVPRTQDADHVREIIRSGSFGLGGDSFGDKAHRAARPSNQGQMSASRSLASYLHRAAELALLTQSRALIRRAQVRPMPGHPQRH